MCNIREAMSDLLVGTYDVVCQDLSQTTLADVVFKFRTMCG